MTAKRRLEVLRKMKKYGVIHYIVSRTRYDGVEEEWGFEKCFYDNESFDYQLQIYHKDGYEYFDVIHLIGG